LAGAEEVALALIKERTLINQVADGLAPALSKSPASFRAEVWDEIATQPESSPVLKTAVFARLQDIAVNPAKATAAEKQLLASTIAAIRNFRIFMAQDALDAYDAWKAGELWRQGQMARSRTQDMGFELTKAPPDFEQLTAGSIMGGLAAGGGLTAAGGVALMNESVRKVVFPFRDRALLVDTTADTAKTVKFAAKVVKSATWEARLAETAAARAASAAGRVIGKVAFEVMSKVMSIGPQAIITIATEVLVGQMEQEIDKANARPQLVVGLATAKNKEIDIARMLGTRQGTGELEGSWAAIMSGTNPARNTAQIATLAQAAKTGVAVGGTAAVR
jgi:hypothetical protein